MPTTPQPIGPDDQTQLAVLGKVVLLGILLLVVACGGGMAYSMYTYGS